MAWSERIAAVLITLVVLSSCVAEAPSPDGSPAPTAAPNGSPGASLSVEARISDLRDRLERLTAEELAEGCTTIDRFGQRVFCGESKEKVDRLHDELAAAIQEMERQDTDVARATELIREVTEDPGREVVFRGTSANPYSASGKRITQYRDGRGFEYWIDPAADRVVQFGPGPDSTIGFATTGELSVDELRGRAEAYLLRVVEGFADLRVGFVYRMNTTETGSRYAFRWEAPVVPEGERLAPFVQVVLSPAGEVMSFTDSRSLYQG